MNGLLDREVSRSAFNIAYSALSFLYGEVLKQPASLEGLRRPRGGRQLPEILSQREMLRLLDSLRNPKHRVILALVYAGGLRVGEVVRLKVSDIDSDRMLIRVRQGKGRKDRYTLLPRSIIEDLRSYWKAYRAVDVAVSRSPGRTASHRTVGAEGGLPARSQPRESASG